MTVKYGFYDSLNHDRVYNANDISTMFEGVFSDGVFEFVGNGLTVEHNPGIMGILVRDGRAWFNDTWIRNTSTLVLNLELSDLILDRIDLIVLEFDSSITVRENSIKILTGIPHATPVPPILTNTSTLKQYALAEIYVATAVSEIEAIDITDKRGTVGTPYTTSLLSEPYILPLPTTTTIGGVKRNTGSAGEFVVGIDVDGNLEYNTPAGGGGGTWGSITGTLSDQTDLQSELNGKQPVNGWISYSSVIPTRTAADDPVFTIQFAGVNLTSFLKEGMPIMWTQNSIIRYGFICDDTSFSTNTTVKVLTRTDGASTNYDVLDTSTFPISNFFYGLPKQPGIGFPILQSNWTLEVVDSNACTKASPTTGVWYGGSGLSPTGPSLDFPIGAWIYEYGGRVSLTLPSASSAGARLTLSTANNSESNASYTFNAAFSSVVSIGVPCFKTGFIKVTSKTTHYLNVLTGSASASSIVLQGNTMQSNIRIRSAYLG